MQPSLSSSDSGDETFASYPMYYLIEVAQGLARSSIRSGVIEADRTNAAGFDKI